MVDHTNAGGAREPDFRSAASWLFAYWDKWTKFQSFVRTRRYLFAGERLFDLADAELTSRQVLTPLAFNIYQSVLSTTLALVVTFVLTFLWVPVQRARDAADADVRAVAVASAAQKAIPAAKAVAVPLVTLLLARVAAWSALHRPDRNPVAKRRARRAYLYLDGSYGVISQGLLSCGVALHAFASQHSTLLDVTSARYAGVVTGGFVCIIAGGMYQFYRSWDTVPNSLFTLHGYAIEPSVVEASDPRRMAPMWRYRLCTLVVGGLIANLLMALATLAAVAVAVGWVTLKIAVAGLERAV